MRDNNVQSSISVHPGNKSGELVDIDKTSSSGSSSLEAELKHYRLMLEKLVQQRTEMLDRRIAILESCNATLGENYHKIHQRYLRLLSNSQSVEDEMDEEKISVKIPAMQLN